MTVKDDIARIIAQEKRLVFSQFDASTALMLGLEIKERCEARNAAVSINIGTWDWPLFVYSMPGTAPDNHEWMRRKINAVRRFQRASYRLLLERGGEDVMKPHWGVDWSEIVFAGGGFPLNVSGAGVIGCITVSGLPGREDHNLVVEAIAATLEVPLEEVALAPE